MPTAPGTTTATTAWRTRSTSRSAIRRRPGDGLPVFSADRRSSRAASFLIDGNLVDSAACAQPVPYQITVVRSGARQTQRTVVQTMTDGGSFYPVEIGVSATPPQPATPPITRPTAASRSPKRRPNRMSAPEAGVQDRPLGPTAQRHRRRDHSLRGTQGPHRRGRAPPQHAQPAALPRDPRRRRFSDPLRPRAEHLPVCRRLQPQAPRSLQRRALRTGRAALAGREHRRYDRCVDRRSHRKTGRHAPGAAPAHAWTPRPRSRSGSRRSVSTSQASAPSRCSRPANALRAASASRTPTRRGAARSARSTHTASSSTPAASTASPTITAGATCGPSRSTT